VVDPAELPTLVERNMLHSQWMSVASLDPARRGRPAAGRRTSAASWPCPATSMSRPARSPTRTPSRRASTRSSPTSASSHGSPLTPGTGSRPWWVLAADDPAWRCHPPTTPGGLASTRCSSDGRATSAGSARRPAPTWTGCSTPAASCASRHPQHQHPLAVTVRRRYDDWEPITYAALDEALTALGFPEQAEDREDFAEQQFRLRRFHPTEATCAYAKAIVAGLATEKPGGTGRHRMAHREGHPPVGAGPVPAWRWPARHGERAHRAAREVPGDLRRPCHRRRRTSRTTQRDQGRRCATCSARSPTWTPAKVAEEFTGTDGRPHGHDEPTFPVRPADQRLPRRPARQRDHRAAGRGAAGSGGHRVTRRHPRPQRGRPAPRRSSPSTAPSCATARRCGRWLHWDGYRWARQPAGGGIAREFAKAIARAYPDEGGWATHKKHSLSSSGIAACLALTETDHRITVDIDALDARPWSSTPRRHHRPAHRSPATTRPAQPAHPHHHRRPRRRGRRRAVAGSSSPPRSRATTSRSGTSSGYSATGAWEPSARPSCPCSTGRGPTGRRCCWRLCRPSWATTPPWPPEVPRSRDRPSTRRRSPRSPAPASSSPRRPIGSGSTRPR